MRDGAAGTETAGDARAPRRRRHANPLLTESDGQRPSEERAADERAHGVVCTVGLCPICALITALGESCPDLVEHLLLAGREVLLALKVLIDARLQDDEQAESRLEHISIE